LSDEIESLYNQATDKLGDKEIVPFDEFLNPSDENMVEDGTEGQCEIDGEDIYIAPTTSEIQDIDIDGPPPELLSNSAILDSLQDILLWVGSKEKGTPDHIRQIESLISDFGRIQTDEKRQVTLDQMMGWKTK
jgi:hypothetical protein